jgi:hypothetical protein
VKRKVFRVTRPLCRPLRVYSSGPSNTKYGSLVLSRYTNYRSIDGKSRTAHSPKEKSKTASRLAAKKSFMGISIQCNVGGSGLGMWILFLVRCFYFILGAMLLQGAISDFGSLRGLLYRIYYVIYTLCLSGFYGTIISLYCIPHLF